MPWRRARLGVRGSRGRPAAPPQAVLPARGRRAVCGPGPSRRPGALSLGALQAPAPRSYAASRGALLGRAPACRRGLPRGPARRAGTSPPGAAASGAARGEVAGRLRRGRALGSAGVGRLSRGAGPKLPAGGEASAPRPARHPLLLLTRCGAAAGCGCGGRGCPGCGCRCGRGEENGKDGSARGRWRHLQPGRGAGSCRR